MVQCLGQSTQTKASKVGGAIKKSMSALSLAATATSSSSKVDPVVLRTKFEDLSAEVQVRIAHMSLGPGLCSRCRWSSGCLSCDWRKALRYHLKVLNGGVEVEPHPWPQLGQMSASSSHATVKVEEVKVLAAGGDTEEQAEACRKCHHVGRGDSKSCWCKLAIECFVCEFAFIKKHLRPCSSSQRSATSACSWQWSLASWVRCSRLLAPEAAADRNCKCEV